MKIFEKLHFVSFVFFFGGGEFPGRDPGIFFNFSEN